MFMISLRHRGSCIKQTHPDFKDHSASGMCRADVFCVWWNFYADQTTWHGLDWFKFILRYFRFAFWEMQIWEMQIKRN